MIAINPKIHVFFLAIAASFMAMGTNFLDTVMCRLENVKASISSELLNPAVLEEPLNFNGMGTRFPAYRDFSDSVSNDFPQILANFNAIATNAIDRFLLLGIAEQYDEDFYIDSMNLISDMRTNNTITVAEIRWVCWPARIDLLTCLVRRYNEPKVVGLIDKYMTSMPQYSNHWQRILSGEAYTNYLEEVSVGLW